MICLAIFVSFVYALIQLLWSFNREKARESHLQFPRWTPWFSLFNSWIAFRGSPCPPLSHLYFIYSLPLFYWNRVAQRILTRLCMDILVLLLRIWELGLLSEMGTSQNDQRMEGWVYIIRSNRIGLQYSRKRYFVLEGHLLKSFKSVPVSGNEVHAPLFYSTPANATLCNLSSRMELEIWNALFDKK